MGTSTHKILIFTFILVFISSVGLGQVQNDYYRLDSMTYVKCQLVDECVTEELQVFEVLGDTLVSYISKNSSIDGEFKKSKKYFVYGDKNNLVYSARIYDSFKEEERYQYNNSLLERVETLNIHNNGSKREKSREYFYEGGHLEKIRYIDLKKQDTVVKVLEKDERSRVIYFGEDVEMGKQYQGDHYSYGNDFAKPIQKRGFYQRSGIESVFDIEYNHFGNLVALDARNIDHNSTDTVTQNFQLTIVYDSKQTVLETTILKGRSEVVAFYEYDENGNLTMFATQTKINGRIDEELKYEIEYDDDIIIPFTQNTFRFFKDPFSSFVNAGSMMYSNLVSFEENSEIIFAIKNMPTKISKIKKDVLRDEWRPADTYSFYYSKL